MITNKNFFSSLVNFKNKDWLEKQRVAGSVVKQTLQLLNDLVKSETNLSLLELDKIAEEYILSNNCIPTFKNYKGFPNAVCISVNNQLVHGIPTNYKLKENDVVKFDLGATYNNVIADSAISCIYKNTSNLNQLLVNTTKECLNKAIANISVGKQLGCIGEAIFNHAKSKGFSVVNTYTGHGIDIKNNIPEPHAEPIVFNKSSSSEGIRIQEGLVIAIEPLLVIGNSNKTKVLNDGWTVVAENISAHFEHTIYVHKDHVEVLT